MRQDGGALVITLLFLVLLTGVALAFLTMARTERATARTHLERMRADQFATGALAECIAILRRETAYQFPVRNQDGSTRSHWRNYATMPGALIVPSIPSGESDISTQASLVQQVPLSSGKPNPNVAYPRGLEPARLNVQTIADEAGAYLLSDRISTDGDISPMKLKWIYIRENRAGEPAGWQRELDTKELPDLAEHERPIIGRYAWWADDESAKANYNLAWKRDPGPHASVHTNPSRPSHPSRVNLMGLRLPDGTSVTEAIADAVFRWRDRSPNRPFNSFADARQAGPAVVDALTFNKFELTHYNHDPDTMFTGEDRILLTTRRDLVPAQDGKYARRFLDILRDDMKPAALDPGMLDDIAGGQQDWKLDRSGRTLLPNKFDATVREIVRYLQERHWPICDGASMQDRYFGTSGAGDPTIARLAVNLIDYVRAKESRLPIVAPLSYGIDSQGRYTLHADYSRNVEDSYMGVSRAPYITEMALHVSEAPVTAPMPSEDAPPGWPMENGAPRPLYPCTFTIELFLPPHYQVVDSAGMSGFDLVPVKTLPFPAGAQRSLFLKFFEAGKSGRKYYAISPTTGALIPMSGNSTGGLPILKADLIGSTILRPGNRMTITKVLYREESYASAATAELQATLFQGVSGPDGLLREPLNRWQPVSSSTRWQPIPYNIGDPRVVTPQSMPSIETDDPRCHQSPHDWRPSVSGANTFGLINSNSTLGKLPSFAAGTPQQDTDERGYTTDASLYMPPPRGAGSNRESEGGDYGLVTSIGEIGYVCSGNVSPNEGVPWRSIRLQPTTDSSMKHLPDWALLDLFSVLNITSSKVKDSRALLVPHETSIGGRVNVNSHVFPFDELERSTALRAALTGSPGLQRTNDAATLAVSIHNHKLVRGTVSGKNYGHADIYDLVGEVCEVTGVADGGEQSEALIRDVGSLLTTRTGVFGVYTIGQSLIQSPRGDLVVTGESRQHMMVERYLDPMGTVDPQDDAVRFRTIYHRQLSP